MKIALETFHGPGHLTVVAGEIYPDDADVVKRWPDKFAGPEEVAEARQTRSHSFTVETKTAKPGEVSNARAVNRPAAKKAAATTPAE